MAIHFPYPRQKWVLAKRRVVGAALDLAASKGREKAQQLISVVLVACSVTSKRTVDLLIPIVFGNAAGALSSGSLISFHDHVTICSSAKTDR